MLCELDQEALDELEAQLYSQVFYVNNDKIDSVDNSQVVCESPVQNNARKDNFHVDNRPSKRYYNERPVMNHPQQQRQQQVSVQQNIVNVPPSQQQQPSSQVQVQAQVQTQAQSQAANRETLLSNRQKKKLRRLKQLEENERNRYTEPFIRLGRKKLFVDENGDLVTKSVLKKRRRKARLLAAEQGKLQIGPFDRPANDKNNVASIWQKKTTANDPPPSTTVVAKAAAASPSVKKLSKKSGGPVNEEVICLSDDSDSVLIVPSSLSSKNRNKKDNKIVEKSDVKPNISGIIKEVEEQGGADDDVIFVEPKPIEVINIDVDSETSDSNVIITNLDLAKKTADADAEAAAASSSSLLLPLSSNSDQSKADSSSSTLNSSNTSQNQKNRKTNCNEIARERSELLSTPDSTTSNDFIDNSLIKDRTKFNFGLHGLESGVGNEEQVTFAKPKEPILNDLYETESSCSASEFGTPSKPLNNIFAESEFDTPAPNVLFGQGDNLRSFGEFITPRRDLQKSFSLPERDFVVTPNISSQLNSIIDDDENENEEDEGNKEKDREEEEEEGSSESSSESEYGEKEEQKKSPRKARLPSLSVIPDIQESNPKGKDKDQPSSSSSSASSSPPREESNASQSLKRKRSQEVEAEEEETTEKGDDKNSTNDNKKARIGENNEKQDTDKEATMSTDNEKRKKRKSSTNLDSSTDEDEDNSNLNSNRNANSSKKKKSKKSLNQEFIVEKIDLEEEDDDVELIEPNISVVDLSDDDDVESLNIDTDISFANCSSFVENPVAAVAASSAAIASSSSSSASASARKNYSDYFTTDMNKFYRSSWGLENFSVSEAQKTMSNDPSKWKIIDRDRNQIRLPVPRGVKCHRCRERGHYSAECPNKMGPPVCKFCARPGHIDTKCPNRLCANCGRKSNYSTVYCKHCASDRQVRCKICKVTGHTPNRCPDLWRRYAYTTKAGTLIRADSMKPPAQRWCSGCSRQGHFEFECSRYNRCYRKCDPTVRSYEDVYSPHFNPYASITIAVENKCKKLAKASEDWRREYEERKKKNEEIEKAKRREIEVAQSKDLSPKRRGDLRASSPTKSGDLSPRSRRASSPRKSGDLSPRTRRGLSPKKSVESISTIGGGGQSPKVAGDSGNKWTVSGRRDLSPQNVAISSDNSATSTDFASSKWSVSGGRESREMPISDKERSTSLGKDSTTDSAVKWSISGGRDLREKPISDKERSTSLGKDLTTDSAVKWSKSGGRDSREKPISDKERSTSLGKDPTTDSAVNWSIIGGKDLRERPISGKERSTSLGKDSTTYSAVNWSISGGRPISNKDPSPRRSTSLGRDLTTTAAAADLASWSITGSGRGRDSKERPVSDNDAIFKRRTSLGRELNLESTPQRSDNTQKERSTSLGRDSLGDLRSKLSSSSSTPAIGGQRNELNQQIMSERGGLRPREFSLKRPLINNELNNLPPTLERTNEPNLPHPAKRLLCERETLNWENEEEEEHEEAYPGPSSSRLITKDLNIKVINDYHKEGQQQQEEQGRDFGLVRELQLNEITIVYYLEEDAAYFLQTSVPGKNFISDVEGVLNVLISIIIDKQQDVNYARISGRDVDASDAREAIHNYVTNEMVTVCVPKFSSDVLKFLATAIQKSEKASDPCQIIMQMINNQIRRYLCFKVKQNMFLTRDLRRLYYTLNTCLYSRYNIDNSEMHMRILHAAFHKFKNTSHHYNLSYEEREGLQHSFNAVFCVRRTLEQYENCLEYLRSLKPTYLSLDFMKKDKKYYRATIERRMNTFEATRRKYGNRLPEIVEITMHNAYRNFLRNPHFYTFQKVCIISKCMHKWVGYVKKDKIR